MIKVLVVEDSAVVREFLVHVLGSDPEIEVIGTASSGEQVLEMLKDLNPDIITMDIQMPKMNGFEATRRIMESTPTPIVLVTGSSDSGEVATTFRALEAGALAVVARPAGIGHPEHDATTKDLVKMVRLMSEIKVVKRWHRARSAGTPLPVPEIRVKRNAEPPQVIGIGTSTGGPIALQKILSHLQKDFPVPVLIVQHMAAGFTEGLVQWLGQSSRFAVELAAHGQPILPGRAYVSPDGFHMAVRSRGKITLSRDAPEHGLRPSVSYLFRSLAETYGESAVGVLLTGMGSDGAEELKLMKEKGAVTFVQDEKSCVVPGMPREALKLDAARYVLTPDGIGVALADLLKQ